MHQLDHELIQIIDYCKEQISVVKQVNVTEGVQLVSPTSLKDLGKCDSFFELRQFQVISSL